MRATTFAMAALLGAGGCGEDEASPPVSRTVPAPAPATVEAIPVAGSPGGVAVGAGAVWVTSDADGTVSRIDPQAGRVMGDPIPVGRAPAGIAIAGTDVWVVALDGTLTRIDARSGSAEALPVRLSDPGGIATGGGAVWVTESAGGTVRRIDPRTGQARAIRVGRRPTDVTVTGGSAWVANSADGTVTRLDVTSGRPQGEPIRVGDEQVLALASGRDSVWAAATDGERADRIRLVRIDPSAGEVDEDTATPLEGGVPFELSVGAGYVWGTDVGSLVPGVPRREPSVQRVDPASGALVGAPVPVGANPSGVAVGAGAAWVTNAGDATVTRIGP